MNSINPLRTGPIKILAVDDNCAALYATGRVLRSAGFEVLEAATGGAALNLAPKADLVVLDVNLPDMDGFEVCRRLRAAPETAQLPVLHLSATFTQSADLDLGLEAGADGYLTRPVEPPVLIATVRALLFARHADVIRRGLDAKLGTIFSIAPVAIAMTDGKMCYERLNPAFCQLTGYLEEELVGKPVQVAFEGDSAVPVGEAPFSGEVSLRRKDGGVVPVELRVTSEPLTGARILVMTDISFRIHAQLEREELLASERSARAEAERSNRLKDEFLATLSHELRNPLNAILGWASVLSHTDGLPAPVMRGIEAIERNSRLQSQMIADLLDYAGITFGKMRLAMTVINPTPIVRAALEVVGAQAAARNIRLVTAIEEGEMAVEADASRLQQIAVNLLINAVKFSDEGSSVAVRIEKSGKQFQLVVADRGKGISASFLPRIFERFSQQDSSSTKSYGGLGLGLAIVKQLVEQHGGTIEAASPGEGHGATFTVTLPLTERSAVLQLSSSQVLRTLDLSGVLALVVEDDRDARELTRRVLTDAGAQVVEAPDAAGAIKIIRSAPPNFLISDIGMAGVDGYGLIRTLRASGYGSEVLPAIALTAFARAQDRTAALAAGFQEHMVKPIEPSALVSLVNSLRVSSD